MTNLTADPVRATLVASLAGNMGLAAVASLPTEVDVLEVRADLLGDVDPEALRRHFTGRLLYTLRSRAEGGACDAIGEARWVRLRAAASRFDLIDLEGERDLVPEVLAEVPVSKRVISWHGPASGRPLELVARAQEYQRLGAALIKLVVFAESSRDALEPLSALSSLAAAERGNVLAFATGACGTWTRLVAAHRGAPWFYFAAVDGGAEPAAPGQPELRRWIADFDLPWLRPVDGLFGVVGRPVTHSLSPRLHNRAYASLGLPYLYLPLHADSLGDFWLDVVEDDVLPALGLPWRGFSVTAPFKDAALGLAGASSPLADRLGSANTLVLRDGVWEADTTDAEGVVQALRSFAVEIDGRRAAVVGGGGAGRVAAAGLQGAGARVVLFNRDPARGAESATAARVEYRPLGELDPAEFSILVQATSLGRTASDPLPLPIERVQPGSVVLDLVYGEEPTPLIRAARERGALAIDGRHVLLEQARGQFRRMTGRELDLDLGRQTLGLREGGA